MCDKYYVVVFFIAFTLDVSIASGEIEQQIFDSYEYSSNGLVGQKTVKHLAPEAMLCVNITSTFILRTRLLQESPGNNPDADRCEARYELKFIVC